MMTPREIQELKVLLVKAAREARQRQPASPPSSNVIPFPRQKEARHA